tara:strand:- start:8058 stop:8615 length:558 start_codon:yes stop_codon:yes gene_type:complete
MAGSENPHRWEKKASEVHADCRIFEVHKSRFRHPVRQSEGDFFVINAQDWITVVATTAQNELITVRQFRFGIEDFSLEVPAGVMEPGEVPIKSAERELLEETGFRGDSALLLGWTYPNPALQNNRCHVIGIQNARQVASPDWDPHEEMQTRLLPMGKVPRMLRAGEFSHALSLCALHYYFLNQSL